MNIHKTTHDFSVLIPVLNESAFITSCLETIHEACIETMMTYEIFVIDGGSTDDTKKNILNFIGSNQAEECVFLLDNPKKIVSSALNIGILESNGEIIFRCDAHCVYEKNYFKVILESHKNNSEGLFNIGSLMNTEYKNKNIETLLVSEVLKMPIAIGSSFRNIELNKEKEVETVPFGSWRRKTLEKVGMFDENFIRGQDMEHNSRLNKFRGKCLLIPYRSITYFSRQDINHLLKMMYQYGFWKVQVMKKNNVFYFRPLVLFSAMIIMSFLIVAGISFKTFIPLIPILIYFGLILISVLNKKDIPVTQTIKSSKLIFQIHITYFYGMLRSIFSNIKKSNLAINDTELTR